MVAAVAFALREVTLQVLLYNELDPTGIPNFSKVRSHLENGDFRSADVKKITDDLYRARLDRSNRLLFTFARHQGKTYILVLEFIANHAYDSSRFLRRGVAVDESRLPDAAAAVPEDAVDLAYVNPNRHTFNVLDKVISFDDEQQAIFTVRPPLIVVGSAGSGKTVLTLEKMKEAEGNVLYVTRSPYLADSARELYYGMNYENDEQDVSFYSFAEFLESIRVPQSREMTFREFAGWFARHRTATGIKDAHQFYEEVHGVITGASADNAWLSKEEYLALGVRQSIYAVDERAKVYDLFDKYLAHLQSAGRHDSNVLSFEYQELVKPVWDFVVVDEVQDLTNVQLHLVLRTLTDPTRFILCGDSNQIVHPNFFSWAGLKRHFYGRSFAREEEDTPSEHSGAFVETTDVLRVLTTNYRSSRQVTEMANRILRLKTARFRSVDRESNYLVTSNSETAGAVALLPDEPRLVGELNTRTRASTRFAVIVLHPDDKAKARTRFNTPLIFSIQEAKGLEYENIILYDFVSSADDRFREICRDVDAEQVRAGELRYARARDKSDKSLEIFKFHINALYVATTRAVANVYLVESSPRQRLFDLLGVELVKDLDLADQKSSLADWQREARKLERQGKQEQADAVRTEILGIQKTPWQPLDRQAVRDLAAAALAGGGKKKQLQLFEYALLNRDLVRLTHLRNAGFRPAQRPFAAGERNLVENHFLPYSLKREDSVRRLVGKYGVDHRDAFGHTPLMLATRFGNPLVAAMLADEMEADKERTGSAGLNAFQVMLQETALEARYAERHAPALYHKLAPATVTVMVQGALLKIDSHKAEFLFYNLLVALFQTRLTTNLNRRLRPGISAANIEEVLRALPRSAVPEYRTKRPYISHVLARHEVDRDMPYNRRLFKRTERGYYILNPQLRVRIGTDWIGIYELLDTEALFTGTMEDDMATKTLRKLVDDGSAGG